MQPPPDWLFIIDAQLPPSLIPFLREQFGYKAIHVNELEESSDDYIFFHARKLNAVILTKDDDFERLVIKHGHPPKIIIIAYGNVGKTRLKTLLKEQLAQCLESFQTTDFAFLCTIK